MTTEMSDNETVDDVLADMLLPRFDAITAMRANNYDEIKSLVANYRDRIKAAYKREVEKFNSVIQATVSSSDAEIDHLRREVAELRKQIGNSAKLREALVKLVDFCSHLWKREKLTPLLGKARAAIAEPARNCDVGTAEEQGERCLAQFNQWRRKGDGRKLITAIMAWAQTPYEAQEDKEGK